MTPPAKAAMAFFLLLVGCASGAAALVLKSGGVDDWHYPALLCGSLMLFALWLSGDILDIWRDEDL